MDHSVRVGFGLSPTAQKEFADDWNDIDFYSHAQQKWDSSYLDK